jgi:hypothetical protein
MSAQKLKKKNYYRDDSSATMAISPLSPDVGKLFVANIIVYHDANPRGVLLRWQEFVGISNYSGHEQVGTHQATTTTGSHRCQGFIVSPNSDHFFFSTYYQRRLYKTKSRRNPVSIREFYI